MSTLSSPLTNLTSLVNSLHPGASDFRMKDNKSLEYFKKGYDLRKSNQIKDDLIISSIHLSDYYKDTDPGLSKKYALEAYQGATDINRIDKWIS